MVFADDLTLRNPTDAELVGLSQDKTLVTIRQTIRRLRGRQSTVALGQYLPLRQISSEADEAVNPDPSRFDRLLGPQTQDGRLMG
jgi:hypothetical protein